ncbi:MAG: hypothetical protein ACRYFX_08890 [Janthinobacterium lividum]
MNTAKIAALYKAGFYPYYLSATPERQADQLHMMHQLAYYDDQLPLLPEQPKGWRYNLSISDGASYSGPRRLNFFGERTYSRAETYCPKRVYEWATQQLLLTSERFDVAERCMATLAAYPPRENGADINATYDHRIAGVADFATLERGIRAYQRKREKYVKKLMAQLEAYHQQQVAQAAADELAKLRRGVWLGAEKALTTAARVNEPGVPFLGDTGLTYEQRKQLGLREYAVYENMDGMSAAFPVGTGIVLKPVKRARELVDGAVYLWQWLVNGEVCGTVLGRLDRSAKERGYLPLRSDDTGKLASHCWAAWENENITIYRVTHYTTRSAAPVPTMQAETQPARVQPRKRRPRRELAYAA